MNLVRGRHLASDITQLIAEVTMRLVRHSILSVVALAGSLAACSTHTPSHEIVFRASSAIQGGTVDQGDPAGAAASVEKGLRKSPANPALLALKRQAQ